MRFLSHILIFISLTLASAIYCQDNPKFKLLDPQESGFHFENLLDEDQLKNPFNYVYAYNGGGVSIGDVNNDGLQDIYITGNMVTSKLFLNKGNMQFEEISESAGVITNGWCSASTMADVNDDGWLDIYVCRNYHDDEEMRENLLFINNQDGTFSERAKEFGINDKNYSGVAAFFDYDMDGDIDLFVSNHPRYRLVSYSVHARLRMNPVDKFSNHLYRNNGDNSFTDVTQEAGLLDYNFSLGVSTSDYDKDGDSDLFIAVDFDEPDVLMQNNGDGTFTDVINETMNSTSRHSMGIDAQDFNQDGKTDFIVTEMLNSNHFREKAEMAMLNINDFNFYIDSLKFNYYHMRNFLHMNTSSGQKAHFSDVSRIAKIEKTDWSWSPLFFDADNDGDFDLHITNGYYRDIINRDRKRTLDSTLFSYGKDMRRINAAARHYAKSCPQTKLSNFLFCNKGEFEFENATEKAFLNEKTISTGSAYGDLDNDGDLDLVINNLGEHSFIYENVSKSGDFLRLKFKYEKGLNPTGAKAKLNTTLGTYYTELLNQRGFQSSSENIIHFGIPKSAEILTLRVTLPNQTELFFEKEVQESRNQVFEIDLSQSKAMSAEPIENRSEWSYEEIESISYGINYSHLENGFNDYDVQILLPHKMSEMGPFISKGDANGDGREDFFIGGSIGQPGQIFIQNEKGFQQQIQDQFIKDRIHEDAMSTFVDIDNDGDQDLILVSGGYEFKEEFAYRPRLYLNDGAGVYTEKLLAFGAWASSSSCVETYDFDQDGDEDVFIGSRQMPGRYPLSGKSALFKNDGKGNFSNVIQEYCPELEFCGMVTDAAWHDLNDDGIKDLIVVGEWMPISLYVWSDGQLKNQSATYLKRELVGWWNTIEIADINEDGKDDLICGNLGLNYKFKATDKKPFVMFADDFDQSGSCDIALGKYEGDELYPVRGRACSAQQIPSIKKKFPKFDLFAEATLEDIYGNGLQKASKFEVNEFASLVLFGTEFEFQEKKLPMKAQLSPINSFVLKDLDGEKGLEIIYGGNLFQSEIETGRADSGVGGVISLNANNEFYSLDFDQHGIFTPNDLKSLIALFHKGKGEELIIAGNNKTKLQLFKRKKK